MDKAIGSETGRRSVFFFTVHKCASSLISTTLLPNARGLRHVDYAAALNTASPPREMEFHRYGHLYGPLRVSAPRESIVFQRLIEPALQSDFLTDQPVVVMVRDPRDLLISAYHSFGFTHALSENPELRRDQEIIRASIKGHTVDEYAMSAVEKMAADFDLLAKVLDATDQHVLLRYEEFITDCASAFKELARFLTIPLEVQEGFFTASRPNDSLDPHSHKRSGKVAAYRTTFLPSTLRFLNEKLAGTLARFDYPSDG